jgi:hypothetical protein
MFSADPGLVAPTGIRDLTELIDLNRILLNLAAPRSIPTTPQSLLGSTTDRVLHSAPFPILIAH